MVETRSQAAGHPISKPVDVDGYYASLDNEETGGDLGYAQEPDAGKVQADDAEDKTYEPTGTDQAEAAAGQNEEIPEAGDAQALKGEMSDLKAGGSSGQSEVDEAGEPVPIVGEVSADEAGLKPEAVGI